MSAEREDEVIRLNFRLYREDNPGLFDALMSRDPRKRARFVRLILDRGFFAEQRDNGSPPVRNRPLPTSAGITSGPPPGGGSAFDDLDPLAMLAFSQQ